MKRFGGITRVISIGLILGMVGFSVASFSKFRTDLEALRKIAKENIYWSASQLEVEMNRFLVAVGRYGLGEDDVDVQDVHDRFDIVWSRIELFRIGEVGERLIAYDANGVVEAVRTALRENEELVLSASREDPAGLRKIILTFEPFHSALHDLSSRVMVGEEARVGAARQTLRENAQRSAVLIAGALAVGVALLLMMNFESRRFRALAARNERLAEDARRAEEAKSRFLTMMSHELRTPMNGVLGLLALIKQRGLPTTQTRLLDQAERSGRQMIDMLTDILDFSALQRDELTLQNREFDVTELRDGLRDLFGAAAKREGVDCEIACLPGSRRRLIGDFNRIRQSLNHLASYVVDTAGARDIRMDLSYADGRLVALLSFDYIGGEGVRWRPDVMLGEVEKKPDHFVTDSLGPAVARGLIGEMGGDVVIEEPGGGRMQVRVSVPCAAVGQAQRPKSPRVLLDIGDPGLAAVCRRVLSGEGAELAAFDAADVDIVALDAGGPDEAERVAAARRRHPASRIVGVGIARDPNAFDAVTTSPVEIGAFRIALDLQKIA